MATQTSVPILNLTRQYEKLKGEINDALLRVAASGHYILGPEVQAFEREMADFLGAKHVIGCASGTDALFLALKALKIGAGDEVITTPFSYVATSEAIAHTGAKPVFVDILPDTMNIDPALIEAAITPNTKAIMPVHIFGQPAAIDAIRQIADKHKLAIVEDCAQSIGSTYIGTSTQGQPQKTGTIGDIGCFSFFPSKNLGAFGDGGMCCTNDDELAERLKMLRVHGSKERYYHEEAGINSRLDEIQAAVLRVKLPHLASWLNARNDAANYYDALLQSQADKIICPVRSDNIYHVFHQYTLQIIPTGQLEPQRELTPPANALSLSEMAAYRERVRTHLQNAGVQAMIYYPLPLYRQGTHANLKLDPSAYPVCETISARVLSLPMFPEITRDEQDIVVKALIDALSNA